MVAGSAVETEFRKQFRSLVNTSDGSIIAPLASGNEAHKFTTDLLEEGVRTKMRMGDIHFIGEIGESPHHETVKEELGHYYNDARLKNTPQALLLPILTLTGEADTKNGQWRMVHDADRARVWAFITVLQEHQRQQDIGSEPGPHLDKMKKSLEEVEVLILATKKTDELWAEWKRANDIYQQDLLYSTDRCTVRFRFLSKLEASLKKEQPGKKILKKDIWKAFDDAEKAGKFTSGKGMVGIKRESDVANFMSFGDFLNKIHMMDEWRHLEVVEEGRTAFFLTNVATAFPSLVHFEEDLAKHVLKIILRTVQGNADGKAHLTKKKVLEASGVKMKAIIKTLVLEYLWCRDLITSCEGKNIQAFV